MGEVKKEKPSSLCMGDDLETAHLALACLEASRHVTVVTSAFSKRSGFALHNIAFSNLSTA